MRNAEKIDCGLISLIPDTSGEKKGNGDFNNFHQVNYFMGIFLTAFF